MAHRRYSVIKTKYMATHFYIVLITIISKAVIIQLQGLFGLYEIIGRRSQKEHFKKR